MKPITAAQKKDLNEAIKHLEIAKDLICFSEYFCRIVEYRVFEKQTREGGPLETISNLKSDIRVVKNRAIKNLKKESNHGTKSS